MAKALIAHNPRPQFFTNTGSVLSGGKIYFYQPGTTTLKNTYTTSAKSVTNPNPVILDSAGRPDNSGTPIDVYLDGSYKIVAKTSSDVTLWTVDNYVEGGEVVTTTQKSADYTITETDREKLIYVDAAGASVTITLMAAADAGDGYVIRFKKVDTSVNTVTIDPNGAETIDTLSSYVIRSEQDFIELYSTGTEWLSSKTRDLNFYDTSGDLILSLLRGTDYITSGGQLDENCWLEIENQKSDIDGISGTVITPYVNIRGDSTATGRAEIRLQGGTGNTNPGVACYSDYTIKVLDTRTSSIDYPLIIQSLTSGTAAIGLGTGLTFQAEFSNNTTATIGSVSAYFTDPVAASADTRIQLTSLVAGTGRPTYEFESTGVGKYVLTGAPTTTRTVTLPDSNINLTNSSLIQYKYSTINTVGTTTSTIALDDTIPQNTEGMEWLTVTITPTSATSILKIECHCPMISSNTGGTGFFMCLFQDTTADALATSTNRIDTGSAITQLDLCHYMVAGTTSATTFKIRIGANQGTTTFLGISGSRYFGGSLKGSLSVYEYTA